MEEFRSIQTWFNGLATFDFGTKGTRRRMLREMEINCTFLNKTPDELIDEAKAAKNQKEYIKQISEKMQIFLKKIRLADNTIATRLATLNSFFRYNGIPENKEAQKELALEILRVLNVKPETLTVMRSKIHVGDIEVIDEWLQKPKGA